MKISIYDIKKQLGQGGMGKVYLAADPKGNFVAIKEMLAEYVTDSDLRARFHQEVKISSQMEHPSIVKMYASFEENGNLYLVMEYVEGETIEQYVRHRGAIDESEAIRLIGETLIALGYAHQKGFVHRDIKPSNIMVRPGGTICLLDFGIAKDMNSNGLTVGQVTIGTDGYMSPEQAGGYNIDHRSDIYSLGCVFFYLLTGHHAIEKRSNDLETRMAIIEKDFPQAVDYNPKVTERIQTLLNKATHKNMQQRFQSCREFELELSGGKTMATGNNHSISIGRENCDINIPHPKVSRHHADIKIVTQSGYTKYLFQDRSSNGTIIDDMKIHNNEIEIIPQNNPVILLAGVAELPWNAIEEILKKRRTFDNAEEYLGVPTNLPTPQQVLIQQSPAQSLPVGEKKILHKVLIGAGIVIAVLAVVMVALFKQHQPDQIVHEQEPVADALPSLCEGWTIGDTPADIYFCETTAKADVNGEAIDYWLYNTYKYDNGHGSKLIEIIRAEMISANLEFDDGKLQHISPNTSLHENVKKMMLDNINGDWHDISICVYNESFIMNNYDRDKKLFDTIIIPFK